MGELFLKADPSLFAFPNQEVTVVQCRKALTHLQSENTGNPDPATTAVN